MYIWSMHIVNMCHVIYKCLRLGPQYINENSYNPKGKNHENCSKMQKLCARTKLIIFLHASYLSIRHIRTDWRFCAITLINNYKDFHMSLPFFPSTLLLYTYWIILHINSNMYAWHFAIISVLKIPTMIASLRISVTWGKLMYILIRLYTIEALGTSRKQD